MPVLCFSLKQQVLHNLVKSLYKTYICLPSLVQTWIIIHVCNPVASPILIWPVLNKSARPVADLFVFSTKFSKPGTGLILNSPSCDKPDLNMVSFE